MSNLINAVDQIKAWAKKQEAVLNLAKELERIGSLEQAEAETSRRLADLNVKVDAAKIDLARVNRLVETAEFKKSQLEVEGSNELAVARKEARLIVEEATAEAKDIVSDAKNDADSIVAAAESAVLAASDKVAIARGDLSEVQKQVVAAKAELDSYRNQLAEAKARAKEVLQGIA